MPTTPPTKVGYAPSFENAAKKLQRKYPHLADDLRPLVAQLEQGETPGDQISGTGYTVYKVRVKNSDVAKGKSGGYRVIYYLKTVTHTILLSMYTKSEAADIPVDLIRRLIEETNT